MTHRKPRTVSNLVPFTCTSCDRLYVVAHTDALGDAPECACGRALTASDLAPGMYQLSTVAQVPSVPAGRAESMSDPGQPIAREADLGYGASHGYSPTHGGPTGPGDAPAAEILHEPANAPSEHAADAGRAHAKSDKADGT